MFCYNFEYAIYNLMNINHTPFTHLSPFGKIHGDIHHASDASSRQGRIVFAHGYKGFKDWGAWDLLGDSLAEEGWDFIRFNFTHNGHVAPSFHACSDETAWSKNTYSIEKTDLESVIAFAREGMLHDSEKLIVMGHSRGGGIAAVAASTTHTDGLVMLASVCDFASRFPSGEALANWKESDRLEILNGRTKQVLSHSFSFYEDFVENHTSLHIESAVRSLLCPVLVIHGDRDTAVHLSEGQKLVGWAKSSEIVVLAGASHTFGASHPWASKDLPTHTFKMAQAVKQFLAKLHPQLRSV